MNEKPEALRLADDPTESKEMYLFMQAAELRRLHADNERLRDELRQSSVDIARAEIERLQEALALAERLAAGRLAMVEQLTGEVEALRRDAESWRKSRAKYIAWQKGGKAEAMGDKT